jgi:hypothetical protein
MAEANHDSFVEDQVKRQTIQDRLRTHLPTTGLTNDELVTVGATVERALRTLELSNPAAGIWLPIAKSVLPSDDLATRNIRGKPQAKELMYTLYRPIWYGFGRQQIAACATAALRARQLRRPEALLLFVRLLLAEPPSA